LSHYQAGWTEFGKYQGNVHYPGYLVSKDEFDSLSADERNWLHVGVQLLGTGKHCLHF
jgi:hypothetical protein